MRKCELCNSVARMYCDSDRAILCWDCDSRVHAANFLVAKHSRTLLCHACQAATPWTGSGPRLRPTVSVCETCVHVSNRKDDDDNNDDSDDDDHNLETEDEDEDDDDDSGDGNNCGDGEDEGNDQVVPVSFTPPPLVSSSSSSEESSGRLRSSDTTIGALKRMKTGRLVLSQAHGNNIKTQLRLWVYFTDSLSRSCIKNMMIKRNKKVI